MREGCGHDIPYILIKNCPKLRDTQSAMAFKDAHIADPRAPPSTLDHVAGTRVMEPRAL